MNNKATEKARELIDFYLTYIRMSDKYGYLLIDNEIHLAKQCATKVCDEVLSDMGSDRGYGFWTDVKQAIQDYV